MENVIKPMVINLSEYYKNISNAVDGYKFMYNGDEVNCFFGGSKGIANLFGVDLDDFTDVPAETNSLVLGNFCLVIEGPGNDLKLDAVNTLLNFSFREWLTNFLNGEDHQRADFNFGVHRVTIQEVDNIGHIAAYACNDKVEKAIKLLSGPTLLTSFPAVYYSFKDLVVLTPDDLKEEITISLLSPAECDKEAIYWS